MGVRVGVRAGSVVGRWEGVVRVEREEERRVGRADRREM